jgi:NAD(P)H dehydrogenase (quinone)
MKVLTVIAHPNPQSFCHAVLERFTAGLKEAGHECEVVDLYAIRFDPVFRMEDFASYVHESIPLDVLERMDLKARARDAAGGPLARFAVSRLLRNKELPEVARFIHQHRPKDVTAQWEKVAAAQGLAFIAPVFWLGFPAILRGWFERVFAYGDAYALTADGWNGNVRGRIPMLRHEKALVISTTMFSEEDYKAGWEAPMTRAIDWGLRYPGIRKVEHAFLYSVPAVDDETRKGYLARAHQLGREYAEEGHHASL